MAEVAHEHELVMLARALVAPSSALTEMLYRERVVRGPISPVCAQLIGDALAQVWPALWRRGGALPATALSGQRGRPWQQHPPTGLTFSLATLELVRWLVAAPLTAPLAMIAPLPEAALTVGDQAMVYLALAGADGTAAQAAIAAQPRVRGCALAWLGFAHLLTGEPPAFDALVRGAGAIVVEALAPELARRWRGVEQGKRAIGAPDALIALGAVQDATLTGFLGACERAQRRDLAGFVIDAAAPLLREERTASVPLDPSASLSRRAAARLASGSLLRAVAAWARWDDAHRGVRFIDDDYASAQVLLARFEAIGARGAARAAAWLADLAALVPTTLPGAAATVEAS